MDIVRADAAPSRTRPRHRIILTTAIASLALTVVITSTVVGTAAGPKQGGVITVQGEAAADTNLPIATSQKAAGGKYLALDTTDDPPTAGWYATYEINAPADGVYRLTGVLTSPAMPDRQPFGGSFFNLSVNGSPFAQVAKSEPRWAHIANTPSAWESLVKATIDDVELHAGTNTITFMVDELRNNASPQLDDPPQAPAPPSYRFFLDEFTLTPTGLALDSIHLGDPTTNVGTYRSTPEPLHFQLNGHATTDQSVNYTITNYFADDVATGAVTIPAGETNASITVPDLPRGSYRITASVSSAPTAKILGYFARLPEQEPTGGPDGKFAVTSQVPWFVPSSRLETFVTAMKDAGAGYVREEISWPLAEPSSGAYDTRYVDHIAQTFRAQGLKTLGTLWNMSGTGNVEAPSWATTRDSFPLPADLRDGYKFANHLAGQSDGIGGDALELWNEPDVDVFSLDFTRSTGDQHAAYLKAAAIGVADAPNPPLISLSGMAFPGEFHDVMLQNDVLRYADIWAYHGYGELQSGSGPALPQEPWVHNDLRRLYDAPTEMWMTEAGTFIIPDDPTGGGPVEEITLEQQRDQARYLVQSTVDSLASGTDKHFWFAGAPYCATSFACFGMLNQDFQPWSAYSAHAAMTSILGQADYVERVGGLPDGVTAHVFDTGNDPGVGGQQVTVIWADQTTDVDIPVSGPTADLYTIMGEQTDTLTATGATVSVTADLDAIYLVTDDAGAITTTNGKAKAKNPQTGTSVELTTADRIVLSQRFTDATPQPPPFGYRLQDTTAPMTLDVYNFNDTEQEVSVDPQAFGGWSVSAGGPTTVTVPPMGRVEIPFTVTAGSSVPKGVDYPLVFDATIGDGTPTTPSVSRVHRAANKPGTAVDLAPKIADITPADGTTVTGPNVELSATITDGISGVDPDRVVVEVDDDSVPHTYDPATGQLTAQLTLDPGQHTIWVRAYNNAHAPAHETTTVTVHAPHEEE